MFYVEDVQMLVQEFLHFRILKGVPVYELMNFNLLTGRRVISCCKRIGRWSCQQWMK